MAIYGYLTAVTFYLCPLTQMAEHCSLTTLHVSFCYKVLQQHMEVIVSLLRAKGAFQTFEAMGINLSNLAIEMLASTSCLTHLCLCGVPGLNDGMVEMVSFGVHKNVCIFM